jgi:hypothetical protein
MVRSLTYRAEEPVLFEVIKIHPHDAHCDDGVITQTSSPHDAHLHDELVHQLLHLLLVDAPLAQVLLKVNVQEAAVITC